MTDNIEFSIFFITASIWISQSLDQTQSHVSKKIFYKNYYVIDITLWFWALFIPSRFLDNFIKILRLQLSETSKHLLKF